MRLLYVAAGIPVPGTHGGSIHALELCRALAERNHEVHLVSQPPDAASRGADRPAETGGVLLHPLPRRSRIDQLQWTLHRAVRDVAERVRPEVVVERFYTFGGTGALAARRLGVPLILEVNTPATPNPALLRDRLDALTLVRPVHRWRMWQLRRAAGMYGPYAFMVPEKLRDRMEVAPHGVDCDRIRPGEPAPDDGPLRCIFVSSFREWHGAEDLVDAVAFLSAEGPESQGPDIEVVCLGDGPGLDDARERARTLGVTDRMTFPGAVPYEEMPARLAAAHVGVAPFAPARHSALRAGWYWSPLKVFEYLAAGLAVVTSDIPALRELLSDEVARFHAPGDPEALASCLRALADDRRSVRGMGAAGRRLAEESFGWDRQAAAIERLAAREGVR